MCHRVDTADLPSTIAHEKGMKDDETITQSIMYVLSVAHHDVCTPSKLIVTNPVDNHYDGVSHVHDTLQKRIGGGVSIYIDIKIPFKRPLDLKLDNNYFESFFIEVDKSVFQHRYNVIIAAIYKPPNVDVSTFSFIVVTQRRSFRNLIVGTQRGSFS